MRRACNVRSQESLSPTVARRRRHRVAPAGTIEIHGSGVLEMPLVELLSFPAVSVWIEEAARHCAERMPQSIPHRHEPTFSRRTERPTIAGLYRARREAHPSGSAGRRSNAPDHTVLPEVWDVLGSLQGISGRDSEAGVALGDRGQQNSAQAAPALGGVPGPNARGAIARSTAGSRLPLVSSAANCVAPIRFHQSIVPVAPFARPACRCYEIART